MTETMAILRTALTSFAVLALSTGAVSAQSAKITVSPRIPTASDQIEATVSGTGVCVFRAGSKARIEEGRVILPLTLFDICDPPVPQPFSETYSFGPLPPGTWTLEAVAGDQSLARKSLDVIPASPDLFFHNRKFRVRVEWSTPDGALHGNAYGVPLSEEAGHLWFFNGSNPEILVKILDGRPVNGHWWVFISSNTNLEFMVHVEIFPDILTPPGVFSQTYVSPAGANKNFIDTETFEDR